MILSFVLKKNRIISIILTMTLICLSFGFNSYSSTSSQISKTTLDTMSQDIFSRQYDNNNFSVKFQKTTYDIKYIRNNGSIDTKKLAVYRPSGLVDNEKMPLIFIAFYRLEEVKVYVNLALKAGFAIASIDDELDNQYFNELNTDTLIFNNAALYFLRHLKGIDEQRIIVMGNSCGGYTALMLNALHLGIMYTVAISPIVDLKFNIDYYDRCMSIFDIKDLMPNCYDVCNKLVSVKNNFDSYYDPKWDYFSPVNLADCFSSHTIVVHGTGDMLVPVGQVSKKYQPNNFDSSMPITYNPFYVDGSLDEIILPYERITDFYEEHVPLKYDKEMLHICIYEDGLIKRENSHNSPDNINVIDYENFFESINGINPKDCVILTKEKAFLLMKKYLGECEQLKAHTKIDDSIYGSLAIYQKEMIEELQIYIDQNSFDELDSIMEDAIHTYCNGANLEKYLNTWDVISKVMIKK